MTKCQRARTRARERRERHTHTKEATLHISNKKHTKEVVFLGGG
jgi:hypothetical protein